MIELIFWLSGAVVAYVYIGYPLLLKLAHLAFGKAPSHPPAVEPPVTLVISAFNEEASIREKLDNTLQLDYPAGRLQVLVVSDASDDRTDDIVREFAGRGVRLLRMAERGGKTVDKADGPMSAAHAGRKPRQSGGGVFSSAKAGTPRSKAQNC
jgi:cellulose synthase/poly-beta-1,6-N-acetylglucosamine synthase-like glycosyltransferase